MQHPMLLAGLARERAQHLRMEAVRTRSRTSPAKPWIRFEVRDLQFLDSRRADSR